MKSVGEMSEEELVYCAEGVEREDYLDALNSILYSQQYEDFISKARGLVSEEGHMVEITVLDGLDETARLGYDYDGGVLEVYSQDGVKDIVRDSIDSDLEEKHIDSTSLLKQVMEDGRNA